MLNQNSESEYARRLAEEVVERWGKHSMSNRKEKKEENREGTQTRKRPNGYPKLEVFEKLQREKTIATIEIQTALGY